jgi:hypothetical protein
MRFSVLKMAVAGSIALSMVLASTGNASSPYRMQRVYHQQGTKPASYKGSSFAPAGVKHMPPLRADVAYKMAQRGESATVSSKSAFMTSDVRGRPTALRGSALAPAGQKMMPPLSAKISYRLGQRGEASGKFSKSAYVAMGDTACRDANKGFYLAPANQRAMPPIIAFVMSLRGGNGDPNDLIP